MSVSDHKELRRKILTGDREKIIAELISDIDSELNDPELYCFLGLAHLLNNQEEEAHATWSAAIMLCFTEFDLGVENLCAFLRQEAVNFAKAFHLQEAVLLREQILNIDSSNLDDHLAWIDSAYEVNQLSLEQIAELRTIDLVNIQGYQVDEGLLLGVSLKILSQPTALSLDFLTASIRHFITIDWLNPVMNLANHMAYDRMLFSYAIDIAKICLEFSPDNFYILHTLLKYYDLKKDQTHILSTALQIQDLLSLKDISLPFACYLLSQLLSSFLKSNEWDEVNEFCGQLQGYLENLLEQKNVILDSFLSGRFWALGFPLLYLVDQPQQVRRYLNQTAQIFQEDIARQTLCSNLDDVKSVGYVLKNDEPLRRIGYIAHTLRQHSVGWLCRWLFKYHDRDQYQIYAYLIGQPADKLTEDWIYPNADCYYHFERDVAAIVEQIRRDQIQVLVDLDVLTHNITAQVLAHKPAPIQVSWLGSDASGLPAMDFFIVDPYVVPEDAQDDYRERLWYLPHTYLALDGFEVGCATLTRDSLGISSETVVYLSVQNKIKSNPLILRLQLQIIQSVPNSLFLIKGGGDNELIREMVEALAEEIGLDVRRVRFLPRDGDEMTHRANLLVADVVLDTYPYNGATTTLETLWMGIPMVTRVGQQFAARNSYGFLTQVGISEGIAWTDEEYLAWGIRFGQDRDLRMQVRERLLSARQDSPLWQGECFTREMEKAFCAMWDKFCEQSRLIGVG